MKRTSAPLFALVSVLALVTVACGGSDEAKSTTTTAKESTTSTPATSTTAAGSGGTEYTASGPIALKVGETATIVLAGNATTGYAWHLDADPDGAVLDVVSDEYTSSPAAPDMVGTGGEQRIEIKGVGAGTTTLDFSYDRSFEPDEPAAEQASFTVTVA